MGPPTPAIASRSPPRVAPAASPSGSAISSSARSGGCSTPSPPSDLAPSCAAQLAGPLAATVVAASLGLGDGDRDGGIGAERLRGWYLAIVDSVSAVGAGRPTTAAGRRAMDELGAALLEHLADAGDHGSLLRGDVGRRARSGRSRVQRRGVHVRRDRDHRGNAAQRRLVLAARARTVRHHRRGSRPGAAGDRGVAADRASGRSRRPLHDPRRRVGRHCDPGRIAGHRVACRCQPRSRRVRRARPLRDPSTAAAPAPRLCRRTARLHRDGPRPAGGRHRGDGARRRFPRLRLAADAPPPTGLVFRKPASLPVLLR